MIGVLLVGLPDGVEIINLSASILMAIAFVPYGVRLMVKPGRTEKCPPGGCRVCSKCAPGV
ncbi:MAG TPA: hypothetical protein PKW33_16475 [Anaerolineaceae bacterium]|nr:hypothetical protein [Anaerolineaceae bacterium]HPN53194.1 hypothetical protein [Anaerolineaceae bacterium]